VRNFYKVLGIASTANDHRVKTAFRRRAKAVHPDLNPGNRRAEARFIELMQAYEVLSDSEARADYDAYLADQRAQSRRRMAHCAGLMMTSFMLTAASAIFVMSLAGANVPFRESWQLAVAALSPTGASAPAAQNNASNTGWSTQVAVAPPTDNPAPASDRVATSPEAKPLHRAKTDARPGPAPSKATAAKSRQGVADASTKEPRQQMATAPRQAPAAVRRAEPAPAFMPEASWPPAPPPADEPRYSLGASDLR
jgi:hypothetical protein